MRMRLIGAVTAVAIVIAIIVVAASRHGGSNNAQTTSPETEVITVSLAVVACVDAKCFQLPVPDVAITVVGDAGELAHGITDSAGNLILRIRRSFNGTVTVTGTSAILRGGKFSRDEYLSTGGEVGLDLAIPISSQAKPAL